MKTKILLSIILSSLLINSCKKDEIVPEEKDSYIHKIYENEVLKYEFKYTEKNLTYVYYYKGSSIDTFLIDSGNNLNNKYFGNEKYEYDDQGRCEKIIYYRSLPDSIYFYLNFFYESDNLSKIEWYGGDGNYAGNFILQYDAIPNPLYILNKFIKPSLFNFWKYQPNNCIEQNSDVEHEEGYALFEYSYSFETQSPTDIYITDLYSYFYTLNESGLPIIAVYNSHYQPHCYQYLKFEYIEM